MRRSPLMGYNHNLRYRNRVYHVQTEDSGVDQPRIHSHVFFGGTIISSARTSYEHLVAESAPESAVVRLMREQHKSLMKQLRRGDLDQKILAALGSLEPVAATAQAPVEMSAKIRVIRHKLNYEGRTYLIQTSYFSTIVTDLFYEQILINTDRQSCRGKATPGGAVVKTMAQEQHKSTIRGLRDGQHDAKIQRLLGTLRPSSRVRRRSTRLTLGMPTQRYHHRVRYGPRVYDVVTRMSEAHQSGVVTEVFHDETLLTSTESDGPTKNGNATKAAQAQHKEMLRQLQRGELDETIGLLDEIDALAG